MHLDLTKRGTGQTPKVGDVVDYLAGDARIKVRVTAVASTSVGSSIALPIDVVTAEEI